MNDDGKGQIFGWLSQLGPEDKCPDLGPISGGNEDLLLGDLITGSFQGLPGVLFPEGVPSLARFR